MSRLCILLIDSDPTSAAATEQLIHDSGLSAVVQTARAGSDALAQLHTEPAPHMVLLDRSTPIDAEDALWQALRERSELPVVVISQSGEEAQVLDAQRRGASQFVQKPLDLSVIISVFGGQGMFAFSASRHP